MTDARKLAEAALGALGDNEFAQRIYRLAAAAIKTAQREAFAAGRDAGLEEAHLIMCCGNERCEYYRILKSKTEGP